MVKKKVNVSGMFIFQHHFKKIINMYVAVYGSLMKGLHNHDYYLKGKSEYIGQFQTEPKFTLISLKSFPGLLPNGSTSITMEVYDVDDIVLKDLDSLEGYRENSIESSYYIRKKMKTPYGEAYYYEYNIKTHSLPKKEIVTSGNWKTHSTTVIR